MKTSLQSRIFAAMIAAYVGALALPSPARAELADISNVPLANSPSDAVLPNLMYILDDSGSMRWDYMPDQIHYTSAGKTMNNCKDTTPSNFADQCSDAPNSSPPSPTNFGEPPYFSPDFNKIYYNPDIFYQAPIDFEGTSLGDAVYDKAAADGFNDPNNFKNLGTEYPEVFYCEPKSARFTARIANTATGSSNGTVMVVASVQAGYINVGDTLDSGNAASGTVVKSQTSGTTGGVGEYVVSISQFKGTGTTFSVSLATNPTDAVLLSNACKRNGIDNLSSGIFQYWSTSTTNGGLPFTGYTSRKKKAIGKGYYYRITPNEYCSDDDLINCTLSTSATGSFTFPAPIRWCKATTDAQSSAVVSDNLPTSSPKCRAAFDPSTYQYPRYGRFQRFNVDAGYTKSAISVRPDCTGAGGTCTAEEEKRNFANWYQWYRTRLTMMKTATGLAFRDIDDRYRVGFITINPSPLADTYLKIDKYTSAQKKAWYDILYAQTNHGGTPLRQALSRVGRMYAGKLDTGMNSGMKDDPVTHSCQQNFALLTTDGYWNDNDSLVLGPTDAAIGNQDAVQNTTAPLYVARSNGTLDGQGSTEKLEEFSMKVEQAKCSGSGNITWAEYGSSPTRSCGCTGNQTAIWERTMKVVMTSTFTSGQQITGPAESFVSGTDTYRQVVACQAPLVEVKEQVMTQTQYNQCQKNDASTFSPTPSGGQVACGCSASSSPTQRRLKQRTLTFTRQVTYTDGVQTNVSDGPISYSTITNVSGTPGTCQTGGSSTPATPSPNPSAATGTTPTLISSSGTNITAPVGTTSTSVGTPVRSTVTAVGQANTLADVAMYYYKNDLRTTMQDNVPTTDKDIAPHQHMVTFTLGLGLTGRMKYQKDYETAATGDFAAIKAATIGACDWIAAGKQCDWPEPSSGQATTLDDLWHAAVNGRGLYYSAGDPATLSDAITGALAALKVQNAAAAASATSSPNITETENFIYSSTFRTVKWDGEVVAQRIDSITGNVLDKIEWSAQANLDKRIKTKVVAGDDDDRVIYTFEPSATSPAGLKPFFFDQLTSAVGGVSEQSWFEKKCSALAQCSTLTDPQKLIADDGAAMVNYLRGRSNNEITVFRDREHVLGDPVNATPAFIAKPRFAFNDSVAELYGEFQTRVKDRTGMLYIAANDGMLHALNGDTGNEVWAYVPRMVFPMLHQLATDKWNVNHQFNVDGSPQIMDIFDDNLKQWRTILVAGLNGGGRGYYALDITRADKGDVQGLWEICADKRVCELTDDDMGLSYGTPVITKRAFDGKWVVLVTSGLNNVSPGTGRGFLYVLDALTGKILQKVEATDGGKNEGDTTTPSGFGKISAFANNFNSDNTATFVYGGDLFGNVWRFDMSAETPKVMLMAELKDDAGNPQSITSRPELGVVEGFRVVYIGTGRYLGTSDLQDPATLTPALQWAWQQTLYAIKDKDDRYGDIRKSSPGLVKQDLKDNGPSAARTISNNEVKWTANDGWYVDFNPGTAPGTSPGERVNLDPQLVLGTLVVVTNVPNENACTTGGDSFLYQFNYQNGGYVPGTTGGVVAGKFSGQITVGVVIVRLPKGVFKGIATGATGKKSSVGVNIGSGGATGRRVSWRELVR